jgi:hypothetical protein
MKTNKKVNSSLERKKVYYQLLKKEFNKKKLYSLYLINILEIRCSITDSVNIYRKILVEEENNCYIFYKFLTKISHN